MAKAGFDLSKVLETLNRPVIGWSQVKQRGKRKVETLSFSLAGWEIALLGGLALIAFSAHKSGDYRGFMLKLAEGFRVIPKGVLE